MSKILCVIDGMTDDSFCPEDYPALASFPERGFVKTVPDGFEPETLPCVLSLLGINPPPKNIRGWIEAIGVGIDIRPDDLIFRGSWMEMDNNGVCVGFCAAPENIPAMGAARYISIDNHKSLLIIPDCASHIGNIKTVLPFNMLGKKFSEYVPPDLLLLKETLAIINSAVPDRVMFPWAASAKRVMPQSFQNAAVVCGANVIKGIAKALGMTLITGNGMTGDTDTDLNIKIHLALELANEFSFVFLHIGGCDEAAHRMDAAGKKTFLSKVDEIVLSRLLLSEHEIEVVSDHGCNPLTGRHIGGEQPSFRRRILHLMETLSCKRLAGI